MQHRTRHHRQKPWLHQNSNSHSIVYDPGGISNDSTFSGATQASSDDITGQVTLLQHTRCSLSTTTTMTTPMPPPTTPTTSTSAATQAMLQGSTLAGRCKV